MQISLGATLYELLALQPMFLGNDKPELIRQVSVVEPTSIRKINPAIPAELETILLKAIGKRASDRYYSAQHLADDLQRYLDNKPIVAKRPNLFQRTNKWTQRNPAIVWSAFAVLLATVTLLGISNYRVATEREKTEAALADSQKEFAASQAINDFVNTDLLGAADPYANPDRDLKVHQILENVTEVLPTRFQNQPLAAAGIRLTVGRAFANLGRYDEAERQLEEALETFEEVLDPADRRIATTRLALLGVSESRGHYRDNADHWQSFSNQCERLYGSEDELTLLVKLGMARNLERMGQYPDSRAMASEIVEIALRRLGSRYPTTIAARKHLALTQIRGGDLSGVEESLRELWEDSRLVQGEYHPDTLDTQSELASVLRQQGRTEEAEELIEKTNRELNNVLGPDHALTLGSITELAADYWHNNRFEEAEDLLRNGLRRSEEVIGSKHPVTLNTKSLLAQLHNMINDDYVTAERMHREVWETRQSLLGPGHPNALDSMEGVARAIYQQKRYEEAERLLREVWNGRTKSMGSEHPRSLKAMIHLARAIYQQGESHFAEAKQLFRDSLKIGETAWEPNHPDRIWSNGKFANLLKRQERFVEAQELYEQVLHQQVETLAPDHFNTINTRRNLADCMSKQKRHAEAAAVLRENLVLTDRQRGPDHPETLLCLYRLARSLQLAGHLVDAEQLYRRQYETRERKLGPEDRKTLASLGNLAMTIDEQHRFSESEELYRSLLTTLKNSENPNERMQGVHFTNLGASLLRQGRYDEAQPWIMESLELLSRTNGPDDQVTLSTKHWLARLMELQGKRETAIKVYGEVLEARTRVLGESNSSSQKTLARLIGVRDAASGQFEKADDQLRELDSPQSLVAYYRGLCQLANHDLEGYHQTRIEMMQRFASDPKAGARFQTVMTWVLYPIPQRQLPSVLELAESLSEHSELHRIAYVATLVRAEQFAEGISKLQRLDDQLASVETPGGREDASAMIAYFLAMAYVHQNKPNEARVWLDQAKNRHELLLASLDAPPTWDMQCILRMLETEIEQSLVGK